MPSAPFRSTATSYDYSPQARLRALAEELHRSSELEKCKADPVYFISHYLKIEEPRPEFGGPKWLTFELWPKQVAVIRSLHQAYLASEYRVMEKCRGVGGTYTCLGYMTWHWLFTPGFIGLVGSRKQEEVDRAKEKKKNTLFAKLDGFIAALPDWLLPKGFDRNRDRNLMLLSNPENKASIMGESSNPGFGKSNRASMVLIDEYAEWEHDVFGSVLNVCKFTVVISTIKKGLDHFTELSDRAAEAGRQIVFDYTDNPLFDEKWLADTRNAMDEVSFAREIMRDRKAAVAGMVYRAFNDCPQGSYEYNPDWPLICFWDFGFADETYLGFLQRDPETKLLYLIDEVVAAQHDIEWFVNFLPRKEVRPNPYMYTEAQEAQIAEHHKWRSAVAHFGDPSGGQRQMLAQGSIFKVLKEYGVRPRCNIPMWLKMPVRIAATRQALKRLSVDKRCAWFIKSFENYHYPERNKLNETTARNENPVHNWASHACTAFEAFCISEHMFRDEEDVRPKALMSRARDPWKVSA